MPKVHFGESEYDQQAQAGARTLQEENQQSFRQQELNHQQRMEAIAAQREARVLQLEEAHARLQNGIEARKAAEAKAATDRRINYEDRMAKAIPELYKIRPDDPKALEKRADLAERYPDLFHNEKGLPSITGEFEGHGRLVQQFQLQAGKSKEAQDAKAAKEAEFKSGLVNPPAGTHAKGGRSPAGVDIETDATQKAKADALKAKQAEKLQGEFDKGYEKYTGALGTLSEADSKTPATQTLLQTKNFNRKVMQDAADKLRKLNPDAASDIDAKLKDANLHEHDLLQTHLSDPKLEDPEAKKRYASDINALKAKLGFDQFALDSSGLPILDKNTNKAVMIPSAKAVASDATTLPPNAVGGQKSNSQFESDAAQAGNSAVVPPPTDAAIPSPVANPATGAPVLPPDSASVPVAPAPLVGTVEDTAPPKVVPKKLPPLETFFPPPK